MLAHNYKDNNYLFINNCQNKDLISEISLELSSNLINCIL